MTSALVDRLAHPIGNPEGYRRAMGSGHIVRRGSAGRVGHYVGELAEAIAHEVGWRAMRT